MTWRDYLTDAERAELERLEKMRDLNREALHVYRRRLQSRCQSRMRPRKQPDNKERG